MLTTSGTEFTFPQPGPDMFALTCVNHPSGRWLTKHPVQRSIHWVGWREGERQQDMLLHPEFGVGECPCRYEDLRVVEDETARLHMPDLPYEGL